MADILDLEVPDDDIALDDEDQDVTINLMKGTARTRKGRGFTQNATKREVYEDYEGIVTTTEPESFDIPAQRSVEGWILMVTGVHEEAHEEDVHQRFSEYGELKNCHLNLDRRTGFLKGYALVEYVNLKDARAAIEALNGADLLGNNIYVDWAFVKKALKVPKKH